MLMASDPRFLIEASSLVDLHILKFVTEKTSILISSSPEKKPPSLFPRTLCHAFDPSDAGD